MNNQWNTSKTLNNPYTSITIWRKNINILKRTTTSPNVSLQFPSMLTTNPRSWVSFATQPHHLKPMQFMIQGQWWSIFLKAAKGASGDFIQWWCCNFKQKSYSHWSEYACMGVAQHLFQSFQCGSSSPDSYQTLKNWSWFGLLVGFLFAGLDIWQGGWCGWYVFWCWLGYFSMNINFKPHMYVYIRIESSKIQTKIKWDRQWDHFISTLAAYNWYFRKDLQYVALFSGKGASIQATSLKFLLIQTCSNHLLVFSQTAS